MRKWRELVSFRTDLKTVELQPPIGEPAALGPLIYHSVYANDVTLNATRSENSDLETGCLSPRFLFATEARFFNRRNQGVPSKIHVRDYFHTIEIRSLSKYSLSTQEQRRKTRAFRNDDQAKNSLPGRSVRIRQRYYRKSRANVADETRSSFGEREDSRRRRVVPSEEPQT